MERYDANALCGFCGHPRWVHSMDQPNAACVHWEPRICNTQDVDLATPLQHLDEREP